MPAADGNTRKLALSGIFLSILMVMLYFYTIIPTNKLTILMLISFIIGIVVIETDFRFALMFYIASVLLSLIFPVNKLSLLLYYSFFGAYGLVKYLIEKLENIIVEYILKILYFMGVCVANYLIARIFLPDIINKIPIPVIVIASVIVFVIYDYLYGMVMMFYVKRIRKVRN